MGTLLCCRGGPSTLRAGPARSEDPRFGARFLASILVCSFRAVQWGDRDVAPALPFPLRAPRDGPRDDRGPRCRPRHRDRGPSSTPCCWIRPARPPSSAGGVTLVAV